MSNGLRGAERVWPPSEEVRSADRERGAAKPRGRGLGQRNRKKDTSNYQFVRCGNGITDCDFELTLSRLATISVKFLIPFVLFFSS